MPFYFAWVANGNTTFGVAHQVEDEEVFAFTLDHSEGDFPSMRVTVVNPRIGLLNPGRPRWAWISYRKFDNSVVPIFHGRLVGFPADMTQTVVEFEFTARPPDFIEQKQALAATLKVDPFYDPIFVDEAQRDDPDTVLAARPAVWHVGRTDKLVSISDILIGEDGTIGLGVNDIAAASLQVQYGTPIRQVHVDAKVSWMQRAFGQVDLTKKLVDTFAAQGAPGGLAASYTGEGLESPWPKHNDDIGGGWFVYQSQAGLVNTSVNTSEYVKVPINPSLATPDFTIQEWWASSPEGYAYWYELAYQQWLAQKAREPKSEARFYLWKFRPTFIVGYEGARQYTEALTFDVLADLQELMTTDDEKPAVENISVQSQSVGEMVDGDLPIGDLAKNSYFNTARAKRSINYLLSMARTKILFAARTVQVTVTTSFEQGLDFSCRKDVLLTVPDLPGGQVRGKIIGYALSMSQGGAVSAGVTIGCCIGRGNSEAAPGAGDPEYAVGAGYMAGGYQAYEGGELQPFTGELTYKAFKVKPNDDGLDVLNLNPDNCIGDFAATALLTLIAAGSDGDTFTIGPQVYTLKIALTAAYQVKLGPDKFSTADNIVDAINAVEEHAGSTYGTGTLANGQVSAVTQDAIVRVTARLAGTVGNSIAVSTVSTAMAWDHPTLTEGSYGLVVHNGPGPQKAVLNGLGEVGDAQLAIDALNAVYTEVELTLKPIDGGPFVTDIPIEVSQLMVPKTIDLEADAT